MKTPFIIIISALFFVLGCSKSGGNTPVQPLPADTSTTKPSTDTTGTTGTGTGTGNNNAMHVKISLNTLYGKNIVGAGGVLLQQFEDGGAGAIGLFADNRLGSYVTSSSNQTGRSEPVQSQGSNGDIILTWSNMATTPLDQKILLSDTANLIYFKFSTYDAIKLADTTYYVFPHYFRIGGFQGNMTNKTVDSLNDVTTGLPFPVSF